MSLVCTVTRICLGYPNLLLMSKSFSSSCRVQSMIQVMEIKKTGETVSTNVSTEEFLRNIHKKLPLRDLRMFLRPPSRIRSSSVLLPRPSSECYIFDMEHVRLLCYSDHCLVMDHDKNATKSFLTDLVSDLTCCDQRNKTNGHAITHIYHQLYNKNGVDFEHVVLENALTNIVTKFKRHLSLIKPALDLLLQQIAQDPATHNLRRLLAFRKSLSEFEQNVSQVMKVVQQLMANDEDMIGLYLTRPSRDLKDHVEVEMLLETNYTDLEEIESDIRNVKDMIEDTNQFISAHLDSVRNKMIRLSLFMEMGALALGSGAVVGGIFGMNLTHGLEEHPTAFYLALGGMGFMMTGIFAGFYTNYNKLKVDTSSANNFKTLKNFFTYVDDLEYLVRDGRLTEPEFRSALDKLTGLRVTDEEFEFIFRMFDVNKDGLINTSEELNIHKYKQGA